MKAIPHTKWATVRPKDISATPVETTKKNPGKAPVNKQIFDGVPKSWTHAPAPEKSSNVKDPAAENKTAGK